MLRSIRGLPSRLIVVLCLLASTAAAADESDWNNLSQIRPGEKVQVVRQKMKTVNGSFESFSEDSIVVRQPPADVVIPKDEVVRVTIMSRNKRWRNLAIGAAAGAGTGFLIGQIITRERHDDWQTIAYFCTLIGLGGGTGIGASIHGHPTVYRAAIPFPPVK